MLDSDAGADMLQMILICACGLALHFAMKWQEARQQANDRGLVPPSLVGYVMSVPAQSMVAVIGTVFGFLMAYGVGWLNDGFAGAIGYMGSSISENMVNQFGRSNGKG